MAVTTSNGDGFALYNGVKFLKMLEYDKVKYPYAYLNVYDASGGTDMYKGETIAELRLSSMPFTAYPAEGKAKFNGTFDQALYFGINGEQIAADNANIGFVDGEWVLSFKQDNMTTTEAGAYITLSELTWCNQDLLNADGSVNFPTTNPIPLDSMNVIEWDGDTTGLEVMDDMYFRVSDSVPSVSAGDTVIVALASNVLDIPPAFTDTLVEEDGYLSDSSQLGQAAVVFSNVEGSTGVGFVKFDLGEQYIYTSLVAYPASGGGSTYDRTAFLSGLAMGLCGKGDPTFETSYTFLYNEVKLPKLPEYPDKSYKYNFLMAKENYIYVYSTDVMLKFRTVNNTLVWEVNDAGGSYKNFIAKRATVKNSQGFVDAPTWNEDAGFGTYLSIFDSILWSNYDIWNENGNLYFKASDPIPTGDEDTFTKGYFAGAALRRKRVITPEVQEGGLRSLDGFVLQDINGITLIGKEVM